MITYLILHLCCFFIYLGFCFEKSESLFIEADFKFWTVHIIPALLIPHITLLLILGRLLHNVEGL